MDVTNSSAKPSRRRRDLEKALSAAIRHTKVVTLRSDEDPADRAFEPHGIYVSIDGRYCVAGRQVAGPGKAGKRGVRRNLEIGRIAELLLTDASFAPDTGLDPRDEEYRHGIVAWIRQGAG
jgi:hypothetical protein